MNPSDRLSAPRPDLNQLSPEQRTVVELLSVFFDSETITYVTRALAKVGVRINGRSPKNDDVRATLDALAKHGVIVANGSASSVPPEIAHVTMLEIGRDHRLAQLAEAVRAVRPARSGSSQTLSSWQLAVRELRIELYAERWDAARSLMHELPRHIFAFVVRPFDQAWLASFPADIRRSALAGIVEESTALLAPAQEAFRMLEAEAELGDGEHRVLVEQLILRDQLDEAERRLASHPSLESEVALACVSFLRGRTNEAIAAYEAALDHYLKFAGKRAQFFPDRAGFFFVVALIAEGSRESLSRAAAITERAARSKQASFKHGHEVLSKVLSVLAGREEPDDLMFWTSPRDLERRDLLEILIQAAAILWVQAKPERALRAELEKRRVRAEAAGLRWYAAQAADVLTDSSPSTASAPAVQSGVRLNSLVRPRERWSEVLDELVAAVTPKVAGKRARVASPPEADSRLVWILRETSYGWLELEPREQKRQKGAWSKGKPIALKRLFGTEANQFPFLSDADRAACATIESETTYEYHGRYARVSYALDQARALLALADGGIVLVETRDGTTQACEIRRGTPRMEVKTEGGELCVSLVPKPVSDEETDRVQLSGSHAVEVVEFLPVHHAIARALGKKPLKVPAAGESQLRSALRAVSGQVAVYSSLEGAEEGSAPVRGEARPCFLLRAVGEGISAAAHVRPFGADGPLARPGRGGTTLLAEIQGRRAYATRDLAEEARRFASVLGACPVLAAALSGEADFLLRTRHHALEAILELKALADQVALEWPDGEAIEVGSTLGMESLRVSAREDRGSFTMRGVLTCPGHADLELADLVDFLSASPGRFLHLAGDERYVALTAELRQRLDELLGLGERVGRGLRIHPLAAPLADELLGSARLDADEAWRRQVQRFTASGTDLRVPSTFRGELRPYQLEGFHWLARLGCWGAGGCLADDMGLGKTVQAIALLLLRAPEGPGLVVAPTSVVPAWVDELHRFGPTLRVRVFAGPNRAQALAGLGRFDLIVTSYSVLQMDIDALAEIEFATAVLDEAQAIKNAETKRAQAALRLRSGLRLVTTGTPIENRLDDLRSIFSFLNPGLLGSAQSFQARFVRPIECNSDTGARERLRRLVAPFVLRRTKTQVLPELPERTDVTLRVPLELEEMATYEVIREQCLAELSGQPADGGEGRRRIRILAAITRLRLAASNARLVLPEAQGPSAKLDALDDLLDDLLPNNHKVLVFSQFVSHLALVKERLDARGVHYQYLDGSTPMAARKAAVDGFQAGEGEVFLISLKAGGFGLNLTAADYVVHMDPWWNPAVEDQASDRAHRMGQFRPVTIYRLVARDTIEDRILALHHRKRELAAGILEGSDLAGSLTENELLELIRGPG